MTTLAEATKTDITHEQLGDLVRPLVLAFLESVAKLPERAHDAVSSDDVVFLTGSIAGELIMTMRRLLHENRADQKDALLVIGAYLSGLVDREIHKLAMH